MLRSSDPSDEKLLVFSSQASLVLIYQPTEGMKGWVDLSPSGSPTCSVEERYSTTQPLGFKFVTTNNLFEAQWLSR
ncbi:hypothetical protein TNCV_4625881 [Trichonephila clavipes]|nr:hypothetical protein TNCV_4625881 [Trichonephila clavipes]